MAMLQYVRNRPVDQCCPDCSIITSGRVPFWNNTCFAVFARNGHFAKAKRARQLFLVFEIVETVLGLFFFSRWIFSSVPQVEVVGCIVESDTTGDNCTAS